MRVISRIGKPFKRAGSRGHSTAAALLGLLWVSGLHAQPFAAVSVQGGATAGPSSQPVMLDRKSPAGDGVDNEVVFVSRFALLGTDVNSADDVYLRTSDTQPYRLISVNDGGAQGNAQSQEPSATPDGSAIVFASNASNLVAADTNSASDIFLRSTVLGQTRRVSIASDGSQGNGASSRPAISMDGRVVAFVSAASNLVSNDTNGGTDVFVRDLN